MTNPPAKNDSRGEAEPAKPMESIKSGEMDLRSDGEERFRKAVRAAAKSGPMHRAKR